MELTDTENGISKYKPPYLPFTSLENALRELKGRIPPRIDRTMFDSKSGTMQSWIMNAFKFFDLIDAGGIPSTQLNELVEAEDRAALYSKLCKTHYAELFAKVDVERATQGQLDEWFRGRGISGATITKAVSFFLDMAKRANIPVSTHFKKSKAGGGINRKRMPRGTSKVDQSENDYDPEDERTDNAPALREKLIIGLVEKLPDPNDGFPAAKRELWKKMADTIFDMVYGEAESAS